MLASKVKKSKRLLKDATRRAGIVLPVMNKRKKSFTLDAESIWERRVSGDGYITKKNSEQAKCTTRTDFPDRSVETEFGNVYQGGRGCA